MSEEKSDDESSVHSQSLQRDNRRVGVSEYDDKYNKFELELFVFVLIVFPLSKQKAKVKVWISKLAILTSNELYKYVQFVAENDEIIKFDSRIQRWVTKRLKLPDKHVETFWESFGKPMVQRTIRRKRQVIMNSMKLKFLSE